VAVPYGVSWVAGTGTGCFSEITRHPNLREFGTPLEGVSNSLDVVTRPSGAPSYWHPQKEIQARAWLGTSGTASIMRTIDGFSDAVKRLGPGA